MFSDPKLVKIAYQTTCRKFFFFKMLGSVTCMNTFRVHTIRGTYLFVYSLADSTDEEGRVNIE